MWIVTMFDLPVDTKKARREYTLFRKFLLQDGFAQMQYSVYGRHCSSEDNAAVHVQRVERHVPPDGEVRIKNDFVFAMTGYRPDFEFLAQHGVHLEPETRRPRTNPETLESDTKGIYLAGVIVAGVHTNEIFIENGRFHGKTIAAAIANELGASIPSNMWKDWKP